MQKSVFKSVTHAYRDTFDLENLGELEVQTLNAWEEVEHDPSFGARFILVMNGVIEIREGDFLVCALKQGGYVELHNKCTIRSRGSALLIQTRYYQGIFRGGFELPCQGVFEFIDGCTDTLLLSPLIKGLPCLNFLYIPPNTIQTKHTHPSIRVGLVISGYGHCVVEEGTFELKPQQFFVVQANQIHQFLTMDNELRIFVFHPDSDFGPSNAEHPMINRSLIEGISVTELKKQAVL
jgi:hypothetical protein